MMHQSFDEYEDPSGINTTPPLINPAPSLKEWFQTEEGQLRLKKLAEDNLKFRKRIYEAMYPPGKKRWWGYP